MNALGTHLLAELRDCDRDRLDDLAYIREALLSAATEVGATILGDTFHQFSPQGVTGIVAIAESHLSIHTWPEYGYAALDVFTCGTSFIPAKAARLVIQRLDCKNPEIVEIPRGKLPQHAPVSAGTAAGR